MSSQQSKKNLTINMMNSFIKSTTHSDLRHRHLDIFLALVLISKISGTRCKMSSLWNESIKRSIWHFHFHVHIFSSFLFRFLFSRFCGTSFNGWIILKYWMIKWKEGWQKSVESKMMDWLLSQWKVDFKLIFKDHNG